MQPVAASVPRSAMSKPMQQVEALVFQRAWSRYSRLASTLSYCSGRCHCVAPNPSVKGTSRKRAAPYVERYVRSQESVFWQYVWEAFEHFTGRFSACFHRRALGGSAGGPVPTCQRLGALSIPARPSSSCWRWAKSAPSFTRHAGCAHASLPFPCLLAT